MCLNPSTGNGDARGPEGWLLSQPSWMVRPCLEFGKIRAVEGGFPASCSAATGAHPGLHTILLCTSHMHAHTGLHTILMCTSHMHAHPGLHTILMCSTTRMLTLAYTPFSCYTLPYTPFSCVQATCMLCPLRTMKMYTHKDYLFVGRDKEWGFLFILLVNVLNSLCQELWMTFFFNSFFSGNTVAF